MFRNYHDINNKKYKEGDIVYNPLFGDLWVVRKITRKQMKEYELDNRMVLCLWDDIDYYVMSIDEPKGFKIVHSKEEPAYEFALKEIHDCRDKLKSEEE